MARSPARTVGGISYDAALSDGHRREILLPASLIVQPPEEPVVVTTSFAAQPRREELFRQARQGTSLRAKSVSMALLATPFVAHYVSKVDQVMDWTLAYCRVKTMIVVVVHNVKTHEKHTVHVDRLVPCRSRLHDEAEETVVPPSTRPRRSPADLQDCRIITCRRLVHLATF